MQSRKAASEDAIDAISCIQDHSYFLELLSEFDAEINIHAVMFIVPSVWYRSFARVLMLQQFC